MDSGYYITDLVREAQTRWLKPAEVLFILKNHDSEKILHEPLQKPPGGSFFLFNRRVFRFFRNDGHRWRRKEAHEYLKVGDDAALNCYYAHGEQNSNFKRRSYWMLDPAHEHIVLVHYRDISEVRQTAVVNALQSSPESATTLSPSIYSTQQLLSSMGIHESYQQYQNLSSPGSGEVGSAAVIESNVINHLDTGENTEEFNGSQSLDLSQMLQDVLCSNEDSLLDNGAFYHENENPDDFDNALYNQSSYGVMQLNANDLSSLHHSGDSINHHLGHEADIWKEMLHGCGSSQNIDLQADFVLKMDDNGLLHTAPRSENVDGHEGYNILDFSGKDAQTPTSSPQDIEGFNYHAYHLEVCNDGINTGDYSTIFDHINTDDYSTIFDQGHTESSLDNSLRLTISQKQKFTIQEISPEWGYASEATKVIIIGSFLCDPSESLWTCMFGDIEVPVQMVREGVMKCLAPPSMPGKVTLCITSGNRESGSEVREFEYRVKSIVCAHTNLPETDSSKSPEEQLLHMRLAQMLLSDFQKGDSAQADIDSLSNSRADEDSWKQVIEAVEGGTWTSSITADWLLQEFLKDKLQQWLYSRPREDTNQKGCFLSKKEQGIIHTIAGLGFEWALHPILKSGVNVNFRDANGWAPLHWAARFGREKIVAALMASGASAEAVTDPSLEDPVGRTPAAIADTYGHKGLAGYLSEVALNSHLSSLTLKESELSKGFADVEAERTLSNVSETNCATKTDELSLKESLAAVRNTALAAARIQSAFRAHSFRKRELREAAAAFASASASGHKYSVNDIQGLSAASKFSFRSPRDYNAAAVSIQKKYRGYKGRKDFLFFRQKVVDIQAHIRGYQVWKQYHVTWAVGVLEKVVLRWRRHGAGLRGFPPETLYIDEREVEDILKVFRKKKVDAVLDEAVSRVLVMVESPEARQQYRRLLEKYRQAKAEIGAVEKEQEQEQKHCSYDDFSLTENL